MCEQCTIVQVWGSIAPGGWRYLIYIADVRRHLHIFQSKLPLLLLYFIVISSPPDSRRLNSWPRQQFKKKRKKKDSGSWSRRLSVLMRCGGCIILFNSLHRSSVFPHTEVKIDYFSVFFSKHFTRKIFKFTKWVKENCKIPHLSVLLLWNNVCQPAPNWYFSVSNWHLSQHNSMEHPGYLTETSFMSVNYNFLSDTLQPIKIELSPRPHYRYF